MSTPTKMPPTWTQHRSADFLGICDQDDEHLHTQGKTCVNWEPYKVSPFQKKRLIALLYVTIITVSWIMLAIVILKGGFK